MKMKFVAGPRLSFEFEAASAKVAIEVLSTLQELFSEEECGACHSSRIKHNMREVEGNRYYNILCEDCGAQLAIGQKKDNKSLWVKRTDKDGNKLPNRGWYHWQKQGNPEQQANSQKQENDEDVPF